jgi:WD40 repeat protein
MTDVFISYSRKDKEFVRKLHSALQQSKREIWIDWEDIPPTADWRAEIRAGIEAAEAFAFVVSPDSVASKVCGEEIDYAVKCNKRLIPLVCRDVSAETTHSAISSHNWLFFRETDDFEGNLQKLIAALDTDLSAARLHTRLLVRALEWQNNGHNPSFTLRGADLEDAEKWLTRSTELNPKPTPEHIEYIQASRQATNARQHVTMASLASGIVIAIVLALLAFSQYTVAQSRLIEVQQKEAAAQANLHQAWDTQALFLANQSTQQLMKGNVRLGLLLALESLAHQAEGIEHPQNYQALFDVLISPAQDVIELRHDNWVENARWNRDETQIMSWSADKTLRVWEVATGKELLRFTPDGGPAGASWSPDESRILSWSYPFTGEVLDVWDAASGKHLLNIDPHDSVAAGLWSPDGRRILTWGDKSTSVWDAANGTVLLTIPGQTAEALWNHDASAIFKRSFDSGIQIVDLNGTLLRTIKLDRSPYETLLNGDDSRLLTWGSDSIIQVWDAQTGRKLFDLTHADYVQGAVWNRDYTKVLSWSGDKTIRVWDAATGSDLLQLNSDQVYGAAWNPDETRILSWSADKMLRVWDVATAGELFAIPQPDGLTGAAWNHDGAKILSWSGDRTIRVWDIMTQRANVTLPIPNALGGWNHEGTRVLNWDNQYVRVWDTTSGKELLRIAHTDLVAGAIWNKDETRILSWGFDKLIHVWDAASGQELLKGAHKDTVWNAQWNHDETRILSGSADNTIRLWDAVTGQLLVSIGDGKLSSSAWSPDEKSILWWTNNDNLIHISDTATGQDRTPFQHDDIAWGARWNRDGARVLSWANDKTVRIWDAATGKELLRIKHPDFISGARWSHDEAKIVTWANDGGIRIWDVGTGKELATIVYKDGASQVQWSPDDSKVFYWTGEDISDGKVYVYDVVANKPLFAVAHASSIQDVAWNRDGSRIISSSTDGTARIWNSSTGELIFNVPRSIETVLAELSPDESRILVYGLDRQLHVLLLDPVQLLTMARAQAVQALDNRERAQFFLPTLTPTPSIGVAR